MNNRYVHMTISIHIVIIIHNYEITDSMILRVNNAELYTALLNRFLSENKHYKLINTLIITVCIIII